MTKRLLIFIASGVGGLLRHGVSGLVHRLTGEAFPFGTLVVNVSGCLAIGFLVVAFNGPVAVREEHRIAILVGLLGGFTTFSSFGRETLALAEDRQWLAAGANILASVALGLAAAWAGARLARWVYQA